MIHNKLHIALSTFRYRSLSHGLASPIWSRVYDLLVDIRNRSSITTERNSLLGAINEADVEDDDGV